MHLKYSNSLLQVILDKDRVSQIKEVRLSPNDYTSVYKSLVDSELHFDKSPGIDVLHVRLPVSGRVISIVRDEVESDYDYVA